MCTDGVVLCQGFSASLIYCQVFFFQKKKIAFRSTPGAAPADQFSADYLPGANISENYPLRRNLNFEFENFKNNENLS